MLSASASPTSTVAPRDRRDPHPVLDPVDLQGIRLRARLRCARPREGLRRHRRQQHRARLQLRRRDRAQRRSPDEPDGQRGRAGGDGADARRHRFGKVGCRALRPVAIRGPRAGRRRDRLPLGGGDEPPQPRDRAASRELRPHHRRPAGSGRRLHPSVRSARRRARPRGHGATLADGGVNPVTGERVVSARCAATLLAVLAATGLYERSGEWLFEIGLPGKSGVAGGLVTVAPGKVGIGDVLAAAGLRRKQRPGADRHRLPLPSLGLNIFASDSHFLRERIRPMTATRRQPDDRHRDPHLLGADDRPVPRPDPHVVQRRRRCPCLSAAWWRTSACPPPT